MSNGIVDMIKVIFFFMIVRTSFTIAANADFDSEDPMTEKEILEQEIRRQRSERDKALHRIRQRRYRERVKLRKAVEESNKKFIDDDEFKPEEAESNSDESYPSPQPPNVFRYAPYHVRVEKKPSVYRSQKLPLPSIRKIFPEMFDDTYDDADNSCFY